MQSGSAPQLLSAYEVLEQARLGDEFHDWMRAFSYGPWLTLATLADRTRGPVNGSAESTG